MSQQHRVRRSNGRFVKKKRLDQELKCAQALREAREAKAKEKCEMEAVEDSGICKGRRIIDMQELAKNLYCCQCNNVLSLRNIVSERRLGVHSILTVTCGECQIRTIVHTGKMRMIDGHEYAESNLSLVSGAIQSGVGYARLKKFLASMEIPGITYNLYKRYAKVVGETTEKKTDDSGKSTTQDQEVAA